LNYCFIFWRILPVEGLYCKRPIQCLASSEILTPPHPLTPHRPASVCTVPPRLLVRGEDTLAGWRGVGGSIVRKTPDTALYSIYKYFVIVTYQCKIAGIGGGGCSSSNSRFTGGLRHKSIRSRFKKTNLCVNIKHCQQKK
jgi:hypothetical protein